MSAGANYSAPPDPLAGLRGPTSKGRGRRERKGREWEEREEEMRGGERGGEGEGEEGEGVEEEGEGEGKELPRAPRMLRPALLTLDHFCNKSYRICIVAESV